MGDFTYFSDLFQTAAQLYGDLTPPMYVTVNVSLTSNEMAGTVAYASGPLVYQPGPPAAFVCPIAFEARLMGRTLITNPPSTIYSLQMYDAIGISVSQDDVGDISVSLRSNLSGSLGPPQTLTNLDAAANVMHGLGTGIASGSTALYTISLTTPQTQGPTRPFGLRVKGD